ncbi:DivIVA domain-containing protein [Staphylococcus massiliensis]|uniref:Cell-division initiation protein n=1 Tax=Staphylococcus massiliensis S46 TaxID=1229783 RepID=K9B9J7_9STAP|nr:DivIVA domain-containing protein [Staphylococcus massiliensis]EKU50390.1 cell-division initiation protein [Staphylococcus massiliensis S46]MCG3401401.1 DivIVA domain-containing protein [Staphylococcus massiliensis]MCG3411817.1 DivIVA domain-containing protein [Staphylococcus massiliensis]PNZ99748.1 DivIVA domain-containing protein [Staphylococcus massiliensis CCUG 55927]
MPFTPSEIKNKEFSKAKNGLDPVEVKSYIEQLSKEITRLNKDKEQLNKVLEDKETNIQSFKDVEKSIGEALLMAQRTGEETKASAQKEAEAIIQDAKVQHDKIVNDAIEKARRLSFQTEDMKRQSKIFRSRFRMLVEAQLDLLKSDDWEYLLNYDLDAQSVSEENIKHLNDKDLTEDEKAQQPDGEQAAEQANASNDEAKNETK